MIASSSYPSRTPMCRGIQFKDPAVENEKLLALLSKDTVMNKRTHLKCWVNIVG